MITKNEYFKNVIDDAIQSYLEDKQDDYNEAMKRKYEERKELRSSNEQ